MLLDEHGEPGYNNQLRNATCQCVECRYIDVFILQLATIGQLRTSLNISGVQGGRTWQAFGGGKNGHETFRQARIYNFRDKCVVFARNLKFSNLTQ